VRALAFLGAVSVLVLGAANVREGRDISELRDKLDTTNGYVAVLTDATNKAQAQSRQARRAARVAAQRAARARAAAERASRSEQRAPLVVSPTAPPSSPSAAAWASSAQARAVAACESGGDPGVISVHGGVSYFGKWQADSAFVESYDGTSAWSWVSGNRFTMPEARQDAMAYRGYQARGWQPWACA
jgi:hypothetical protein